LEKFEDFPGDQLPVIDTCLPSDHTGSTSIKARI